MCFGKKERKRSFESVASKHDDTVIREPKLLVIGAGAAGLACATKLLKLGFSDVVIYEAQNRIGGRINTIPFADNVVDLGAQWCHGENVIYEMVKELSCLDDSDDCYYKSTYIRSDGTVLDESTIKRLKNIMVKIFQKRYKGMRTYKGSYGAYLEEQFLNAFDDNDNDDIDELEAMEFFVNFLKIEGAETACNIHDVSASGFLAYWECEGNYMLNWKDKGFSSFLRLLLRADDQDPNSLGVLSGRVRFNMHVDHIYWGRDDNMIEVKCSNSDESLLVDHVILTVSLGVLKENHSTLFTPPLPDNKVDAIMSTGYGSVLKIYLEFTAIFWPHDWCGFNAIWSIFDMEAMKDGPRGWLIDLFGFYRVSYQPRVLVGWLGGPHIQEVEQMQKSDIQEDVMFMLRKFLPKFKIPLPKNIVITSWTTNPNFLGTYSYPSMLTPETGPCFAKLAQPLSILAYSTSVDELVNCEDSDCSDNKALTVKPMILFAGEATSTHYFSTVHGAIESGWREAKRLAGYYNKE